jgi:ABC-2 type transport system ATP-binding protein
VFVSSHLMSEMANTADQLVVIGRGKLLAAESLAQFEARGTRSSVTVRTADPAGLAAILTAEGGSVRSDDSETLTVTGLKAARIGALAFDNRIIVHELATRAPSLEDAFMALTADSVEYTAGETR